MIPAINQQQRELNQKWIKQIHEAASEAYTRLFDKPMPGIIAGGAIRDTVIGIPPKDFDLFLDVSDWTEEELSDNLLLFGDYLLENLRKGEDETLRNLYEHRFERPENEEEYRDPAAKKPGDTSQSSLAMVSYLGHDLNEWYFDQQFNGLFYDLPFVQILCHRAPHIASDPAKFVDEFDWAGVKGWYSNNDFHYDGQMATIFTTRNAGKVSDKTERRIERFNGRCRRLNINFSFNYGAPQPKPAPNYMKFDPTKNVTKYIFEGRVEVPF